MYVIGHFRILGLLSLDVPSLFSTSKYSTATKMCFDDRDTYRTRTYVANGASRVSEEYTVPRCGMSWRRRHGFGGSYYPSRYYSRPPHGRYMSNALVHSNRYSGNSGYPHRHSYPPYGAGYPGYPGYNGYPRGVVPGGYMGYSSGYGRYNPGASVAMPRHAAVVSLRSFLPSPIPLPSCLPLPHRLPHPHWLAWLVEIVLSAWLPCTTELNLAAALPSPRKIPYSSPLAPRPADSPHLASATLRNGGLSEAAPPVHLHPSLWPTRLPQLRRPVCKQRTLHWRHTQRRHGVWVWWSCWRCRCWCRCWGLLSWGTLRPLLPALISLLWRHLRTKLLPQPLLLACVQRLLQLQPVWLAVPTC